MGCTVAMEFSFIRRCPDKLPRPPQLEGMMRVLTVPRSFGASTRESASRPIAADSFKTRITGPCQSIASMHAMRIIRGVIRFPRRRSDRRAVMYAILILLPIGVWFALMQAYIALAPVDLRLQERDTDSV